MPHIPRKCWIALGLSLAVHGAFLVAIFQIHSHVRATPAAPRNVVDNRMPPAAAYCRISVSFDEAPRSSSPPIEKPNAATERTVPKERPVAIPKEERQLPKEGADANSHAWPSSMQKGSGAETGNGSESISPLHGKITRAGASIVYVLDRSGSMGRDRKLRRAIAMLKSSLKQLGPDSRFQIVTYDSQASAARIAGAVDLIVATPANIAEAESQLDELVGEGASKHIEGLRLALSYHPDLLILITDADELSPKDVKALLKWNENKTTSIHAVLLNEGQANPSSSLQELVGAGNVHFIAMPGRTPLH